jgi:hypothetical protein
MFKKIAQFKWVLVLAVALIAGDKALYSASSNIFSDIWAVSGTGTLNSTSVAWIDGSAYNLNLYQGSLVMGMNGSRPSTTSGTYPNIQVPFYNANTATSITAGDILLAQTTSTTSGYMVTAPITATTTVAGIAMETVAPGAVGRMAVSGYALVHTSGTVYIGDLIVSSATSVTAGVGSGGYGGRIGAAAGTSDLVGVVVGRAMSVGTAAGGSTLVKLN